MNDVVSEIRVRGMRTIVDATLKLKGLTVLIGENGAGKSTLIEACELLRRVGSTHRFIDGLNEVHGGFLQVANRTAQRLELWATIRGGGDALEYRFSIHRNSPTVIEEEHLVVADVSGTSIERIIERHPGHTRVRMRDGEWREERSDGRSLTLFDHRHANDFIGRAADALESIEVHAPFEIAPLWVARRSARDSLLRSETVVGPVESVGFLGANLANAWNELRNGDDETWRDAMDDVRLGLGDAIEAVVLRPSPGGGRHALYLRYRGGGEPIPAFQLSDGQLAYLAFVAMFHVGHRDRALLAFDEPEVHLHPRTLLRVVDLFESEARNQPVLLATHSDRLLDALTSPETSAVLCDLDERRETRLVRPDEEALKLWLARYRGLGALRAEGYERHVMTDEVTNGSGK